MFQQVLLTGSVRASIVLVALSTSVCIGATDNQSLPENAQNKKYGTGWECKTGYRKKGSKCLAVVVPEHGYLEKSAFGKGWSCHWGYREVLDKCEKIAVPDNSYLTPPAGKRWACNRGYRKTDNDCVKIKVPENAYLTERASWRGWRCERGYREVGGKRCVAVKVPANAHIDYSGADWTCNRPHRRDGNTCVMP